MKFYPDADYYCGACEAVRSGWEDPRLWDMRSYGGGLYVMANCPHCHSSRLIVELERRQMLARSLEGDPDESHRHQRLHAGLSPNHLLSSA